MFKRGPWWFLGALVVSFGACSSEQTADSGERTTTDRAGSEGVTKPSGGGRDSGASGRGNPNGGSTSSRSSGGTASGSGAVAGQANNAGADSGEPVDAKCVGTARFAISVELTWDDPKVENKHYTTVVGAVHAASVSFWKLGAPATPGIKAMAETGATTPLDQEVNVAVAAGTAQRFLRFGGGDSPGKAQMNLEVRPEFPLVSFGSMLAPTPDWFVGVSSFSLCQEGRWLDAISLDAVAYDAGTKDGSDFTYGEGYTNPPTPIALQPTLAPGGVPRSFGTLRFQRVE